jgi:ATP-dependent protease ClpP protease subunit
LGVTREAGCVSKCISECVEGGEEGVGLDEEEQCGGDDLVYSVGSSVYLHAEINRVTVNKLVRALDGAAKHALSTAASAREAEVRLYINSEGGDVFSGISAMSHVRRCRVPVTTVVDGFVASAATFVLLAGKRREMCRYSKVLIHQVRSGFWGKYVDLLDEVKNLKDLMRSIRRIYEAHTRLDRRSILRLLRTEVALNSTQCLEANIVSEVVE